MAHFLTAAGWGVLEGYGFEVHPQKVGFCPQSVGNVHLGLSSLRAFLKGQFGLGQICSSLKAGVLGDWNGIPCPSQNAGGYQVFSIYRFDLHSEGGEGPMATSEQKQKVLGKDQVLAGKVSADSISELF